MHCLEHASPLECVHNHFLVLTALAIEHKLGNARLIGTMYAGAIEKRGVENYATQAFHLGRKLVT